MNNDLAILLIGTLGMLTMIGALIFFAYLYQKKMLRKQQEMREIEQLLKREELNSAYSLLEGQENERQRIAQDLHDGLGGSLSTIKIYLDLLHLRNPEEKSEMVEKLRNLTDEVIENVRDIAHNLSHSSLTYYGLEKSIEHLCNAVSESSGIAVQQHVSIHATLEKEMGQDLYKIIQELLNNSLKHARATAILIELTALDDEINLIYEDNGIGFNEKLDTKGIGLHNISIRVQRYGGQLTLNTAPGKGTSTVIEIPLKP